MESDYDQLHASLWALVAAMDGRIERTAQAVVDKLIASLKAEGYEAGPETRAALTAYLESTDATLLTAIRSAIPLGSPAPMGDAVISRLATQAFEERWPDGLRLSDRLWKFKTGTERGFFGVLQEGARTGRSTGGLVYDLQRQIEARGARFDLAQTELEDWATLLADAGRAAIHNPSARESWYRTVAQVREHLNKLSDTGTRQAAEVAFKRIRTAVAGGQEALINEAVQWWMYDKQLSFLKRIARTEMATAQHRAVIASAIDDPDIIGFHWQLSSSHPRPDICDYYAGIDMGLGKGVWTKEAVPKHKAHPHCMCKLSPRVSKVKQPGALNYAEFIQGVTPERRAQLLPAWAREAQQRGVELPALIRPDGLGLISKADALTRFGDSLIK